MPLSFRMGLLLSEEIKYFRYVLFFGNCSIYNFPVRFDDVCISPVFQRAIAETGAS